jgi:HlyD family secretion protein
MKGRVVLALVLLAGAAALWFGVLRPKSTAVRYREAAVTRGEIDCRVSATGTLNPVDQVEIGSQVSGTIQRLYVDYNSQVKAGQVLAQIDPALFKANRSQAEANVEKAQVALEDAERTRNRTRDLMKQGLVAQSDVDAAETAYGSRRAELRQAQATLDLANVNLANTTITSPISGIVISRSIDVGQTVAASLQAPKLFVIARDLSEMELEAQVDEADIGQVAVGQPVSFTVDSYPDRTFEGHVLQVRAEPIEDSGVVSYVTVVRVPNPEGKLLPGMTANVTIITASREDVLRVPNAALRYKPKSAEPGATGRMAAGGAGGTVGGRGGTAAAASGGGPPDSARAGANGGASRGTGGAVGRGRGAWTGRDRSAGERPAGAGSGGDGPAGRGSTIYVLDPGTKAPSPVHIRTGITDGTVTEVLAGPVEEGTLVVIGELESNVRTGPVPNPLGGATPRGGGRRRGP